MASSSAGRRGSDSRAAPSSTTVEGRLGLESRPTTTPSPLRSPIPRAAPSPLISHRQAAQTAAELERDQSESSDAQAGPSDKKKGAGWRRAFKRDKEREYALLSPASASVGYQPGTHSPASSHSADDTGRKGLIQESMTIQTPHRRPSTSSAAKTEHSDVSGQTQLRAVRNPPLHGHGKEGGGSMSKRDAKKAAEHTSEFSVEAIRDAVSPSSRSLL